MADNILAIGLGEIAVSRELDVVLISFGLGSCVGITMYDPIQHVGGMLHAVLPEATNGATAQQAKFVDTGVALLLNCMIEAGAVPSRLILKMAGGANMLTAPGMISSFDIGTRNVDSAHTVFNKMGMNLVNEEVGGSIGRTVRLYVANGRMTIRMMGGQEREI